MTNDEPTVESVRAALRDYAAPEDAVVLASFFKSGPGEYGEGDQFLGVRVPDTRKVVPMADGLSMDDLLLLLGSPIHEERLLALLAMVRRFERGALETKEEIVAAYLANARLVNNWDLVDSSAAQILGAWLLERPPKELKTLRRLAKSENLWERRIAIIATYAFIRAGNFAPVFEIAEALMSDSHDLIHKASGWMLREAGKRDPEPLRAFLTEHAAVMPRTMLRYAIERFTPAERQRWMAVKAASAVKRRTRPMTKPE